VLQMYPDYGSGLEGQNGTASTCRDTDAACGLGYHTAMKGDS
jgi:hypothetical protein